MSIFPFTNPEQFESEDERRIPLAREYAYDFEKGDFKLKNNKLYLVEGNEAIKIWITKAIITGRYKEVIHTWFYGGEFEEKLVGKGYSKGLVKSEAERYTRECLLSTLSHYIKDLREFDITFNDNKITISFTAETIYGEVDVIV